MDIIILTECRLSSNKPIPQLPDYTTFATTRQINENDGVVVYIKNNLKAKIQVIKLDQATCIQINILNNTILGIYRSPSNTNADLFINSLNLHLETIKSRKNITLVGDININIIPKTNEQTYERNNRANYLKRLHYAN